jgi:hypothetical protein
MYRNTLVRPLPDDEQAAWKIVIQDMPELAKKK